MRSCLASLLPLTILWLLCRQMYILSHETYKLQLACLLVVVNIPLLHCQQCPRANRHTWWAVWEFGHHERHAAQGTAHCAARLLQELAVALRAHAVPAREEHPHRIGLELVPTHLQAESRGRQRGYTQ